MKNVERVEVVYGPASALYGADALAGIINIVTFNPEENMFLLEASAGPSGYESSRFFMNHIKQDLKLNIYGGYNQRNNLNIAKDSGAFSQTNLFGDAVEIGRLPSESKNIGTGHATVSDIPDNGHSQSCYCAFFLANGKEVKQGLGGMLVHAVARVDDGSLHMFGQKVRGTRRGMAKHDDIGIHGFKILGRIQQGFTFNYTAGGGRNVEGVGTQAFGSNLKRRSGSGTGFVE